MKHTTTQRLARGLFPVVLLLLLPAAVFAQKNDIVRMRIGDLEILPDDTTATEMSRMERLKELERQIEFQTELQLQTGKAGTDLLVRPIFTSEWPDFYRRANVHILSEDFGSSISAFFDALAAGQSGHLFVFDLEGATVELSYIHPLTVPSGVTLAFTESFRTRDVITINGRLKVTDHGEFINTGTFHNNNLIQVAAGGLVSASGTFNNSASGTITVAKGGKLDNTGTFNNAGTITVAVEGEFSTFGTLTNGTSGKINGEMYNRGRIVNASPRHALTNNEGTIDTILNVGCLDSTYRNATATIQNSGTINTIPLNDSLGTIINKAGGTIQLIQYNLGKIDNQGTILKILYNLGS